MARDPTEMVQDFIAGLVDGHEQCEAAWAHIRGCDRCKKVLTLYALAVRVGEQASESVLSSSECVDAMENMLRYLVGSDTEVASLLDSIFGKGEGEHGD